jgi:hypothetical protein
MEIFRVNGCLDCVPAPHEGGYGLCECDCHFDIKAELDLILSLTRDDTTRPRSLKEEQRPSKPRSLGSTPSEGT